MLAPPVKCSGGWVKRDDRSSLVPGPHLVVPLVDLSQSDSFSYEFINQEASLLVELDEIGEVTRHVARAHANPTECLVRQDELGARDL